MSRRAWGGFVLLVLTLLARLFWLTWQPVNPIEPVDAEGYHLIALNLLAGRGFSMVWNAPFCPVSIRTPLYPLLLALTYRLLGSDPARAVLAHLLLETLTAALVLRLGRELGGRRVGLLAGLLYAFNGATQRYTGVLYAETLLLAALAAALLVTARALHHWRARYFLSAGVFWGLAVLIKPNVQFLALAVGGVVLLACVERLLRVRQLSNVNRQGQNLPVDVFRSMLFFAALGLALFPWLVRNRLVFDRWLLSTAYEENLARVSAVATLAEVQSIVVAPWTPTWEMLYGQIVAEAAARYGWDARAEFVLPCAERELRHAQVAAVAGELVAAHPQALLRAHVRGVLRSLLDVGHNLWYPLLTGRSWAESGVVTDIWGRVLWSLERGAVGDALLAFWRERVTRAPLDAALIWWGLLLGRAALWGLGLRGLWRIRTQAMPALMLAGCIAYFVLLPGPIAYDRFYLPAIPAVIVLAALGMIKR